MPYPASPPAPPALITTPSKEVTYPTQAPHVVSTSGLPPVARHKMLPYSVGVGSPIAEVESLPTIATFVQQAGASQASLLGSSTTTGYLLKKNLPPSASKQLVQAVDSKQKLNDKTDGSGDQASTRQEQLSASALSMTLHRLVTAQTVIQQPKANASVGVIEPSQSAAPFADASRSLVYSFSGATQQPGSRTGQSSQNAAEAAVMSGLSDAIILDEFAQETLAQEEAGTPTKRGLEIRAQASDQAPLLLPLPTLDQPAGNPLSVPPTVPGVPPTLPNPSAPSNQPTSPNQTTSPSPTQSVPSGSSPPGTTPSADSVIELTADRQEYDELHKTFTAEGKVLMRFRGALLDADRVQVNLDNRLAVAEGNVALTRGNQVLRGQRLEYSFVQGTGTLLNARGEIFIPKAGTDLAIGTRSDNEGVTIARPVSDRVTAAQPTQNVGSPDSLGIGIGFGRDISRVPGGVPQGGQIRRLRFEADQIDFTPDGWVAKNIQITNDPFSPPELVLKAEQATLTRVSPLRDEVRTRRPRLVFDQRLTLPVFVPVIALDRRQRSPALFRFGYDDEDRGGLFIERSFDILSADPLRVTFTPQFFLQRALSNGGNPFKAENFGFKVGINADPGPFTTIRGKASFTTLDVNDLENNVRASLRARQIVGSHILALDYTYRDRLFNGSLGFQTVQSSLGAVVLSPKILLGKSGIELTYQAGFQYVTADTDRLDLLEANRTNNRISLGRFGATAQLARGFTLWQGTALPPTQTEGLRYSPVPLTPYVNLGVTLRGVVNAYTSGDTQQNLIASVGLSGQFGHFSRDYLDYTAFSISYAQFIGSGQSPFLFDRTVDTRILSIGVTQQLYGPFRIGFQTSINLDSNNQFSTDYILEYSRRTYAIVLRYNPVLAIGAIGLRISDFNWTGGTDTFEGADITPVEGGAILRRDE
ncbi:MAG: DUF3769 domain-containing protein [Leptolyngbya sp. BL-A-14]